NGAAYDRVINQTHERNCGGGHPGHGRLTANTYATFAIGDEFAVHDHRAGGQTIDVERDRIAWCAQQRRIGHGVSTRCGDIDAVVERIGNSRTSDDDLALWPLAI